MSAPKRIQLSRRKGYKKPEGAVVVSRPTKWGNPYTIDVQLALDAESAEAMRRVAVDNYMRNILGMIEDPRFTLPFTIADVKRELRGKDLACWCPLNKRCHADVLLALANEEPQP